MGWVESDLEPNFRGTLDTDRLTLTPIYIPFEYGISQIAIAKGHLTQGNVRLFIRPHFCTLAAALFIVVVLAVLGLVMLTGFLIEMFVGRTLPVWYLVAPVTFIPFSVLIYKRQVRSFFRHAAIVAAFFSTIGDVTIEE